MNNMVKIFSLFAWRALFVGMVVCLSLSQARVSAALPVFPGAAGFGTETPAGRGGRIVRVTNLADSGPGSLREALSEIKAPRIVVFDVGGVIELASPLVVRHPFLTVAGQTAPAPGIILEGFGLRIHTHDVLLQHLFIRANPALADQDCISIQPNRSDRPFNVVIDHCSLAWANDENLAIFPGYDNRFEQNMTISNCLIAGGHYGVLIGSKATNITLLRNIVMHSLERQPRLGGGTTVNLLNNLFYNVSGREHMAIGSVHGPDRLSLAGNVFLSGPDNRPDGAAMAGADLQAGSRIYAPTSGPNTNQSSGRLLAPSLGFALQSAPPVPLDAFNIIPAAQVESLLAATVGARPAERKTVHGNQVDKTFLGELAERRGRVTNRFRPEWPWPTTHRRDFGLLSPIDPNGDADGDSYSNIEEVLQEMAVALELR
ncbi:MAG: hypothetical protein A2091_12750 [Desulfuromonadales bacterium GWD2_61_12]|nr:MAG: hypothetical protein A2005_11475 [Desulfuromonadales bacterium GWC2_61_20]OGR36552.1 MAG: hypothetical protein A2091_12750 [Desulfuromonadales bacterium GWD2_61_12]HAD05055.1 hypothetical protein [Desulfuromonas sp.]